jgi:protein ImuA
LLNNFISGNNPATMPNAKNEILARLQKEILPLQGFRPPNAGSDPKTGLGAIEDAFPNGRFPTGAIHEFISAVPEQHAAAGGFIAGILAALMQNTRVCIWISTSRTLFPPALKLFGVEPDRMIFIDLQKERDVLWAMEEALKCDGLAAVIGETREIGFTASRRLQLAVEKSRVTGFVLRAGSGNLNTIACIARWKITPLPTELEDGLPGIGFPRWQVELLKIRNGHPGVWRIEWSEGRFKTIPIQTGRPLARPITNLSRQPRQPRQPNRKIG